ncbi:MAG TPA: hypothetical protein VF733_04375 [Candidatus Saccharimonadales bacterium]
MKAAKKNKKLIIIAIAALVLIAGIVAVVVVRQNNYKCDVTACASGDNCVAPNDAIVNCEELRKNPTKTDWWGSGSN